MEAAFLDHYNRELSYLRELGGEFARQYPNVASRLGMDEFHCEDPYVERLLEGFAFLAARVHRRIDSEFPKFTGGLLDSIFPDCTRPIPSAAIFEFTPDPDEGSLQSGYPLKRGTKLKGPSRDEAPTPLEFQTTRDTVLWPLQLADVHWIDRRASSDGPIPTEVLRSNTSSALRLRFETTAGLTVSSLDLDRLTLHLRGGEIAHRLYELLLVHRQGVAVGSSKLDRWSVPKEAAVQMVGFEESDSLLPGDARQFQGYRWLQEYFLLPEKFLFVDLCNLKSSIASIEDDAFEIVIAFEDNDDEVSRRLNKEHLALHCVPGVNLISKRADRVNITDANPEHQLIVDRSRPMDFEIWSIEQLHGHGKTVDQPVPFLPLYAPPAISVAAESHRRHSMYYTMRRERRMPSERQREYGHRSPYLGSEVFVTLTDSSEKPARHDLHQLSASVLCTNRDLAKLTPAGGWGRAFQMDGPGPVVSVQCLKGPTEPKVALADDEGERCWRLIQHLQMNALTLSDDEDTASSSFDAAGMFRRRLGLYCSTGDLTSIRQISGIQAIRAKPVTRQIPLSGPIVYGRGTQIDMQIDESAFEGAGAILLACVLDRFFELDANLNSFTQFNLSSTTRGSIHQWPVRLGKTTLL